MPLVVKVRNFENTLIGHLNQQLNYYFIMPKVGGLSNHCWVKLGDATLDEIKDKNDNPNEIDNKGWINLLGFSRIDGYPMFYIPDENRERGDILTLFRNNRITTISSDGLYVNWILNENIILDLVSMLEDHMIGKMDSKIKKVIQVFSETDPYGEENWVGEPAVSYKKTSGEADGYLWSTDFYSPYSNRYIVKKEIKKQRNISFISRENDLTVQVNGKNFRIPARLKNIAQHIDEAKEILNYTNDWDDEGAVATDGPTFEKAASFVIDYAVYVYKHFATVLSEPYIDIMRDGSVSVHWENGENTQLLIIFKKEANDLAYYYAEQSDRKIPFKSAIVPGEPVNETLALWMKNHLG